MKSLFFLLAFFLTQGALAEGNPSRVALVIGNAAYEKVGRLANPVNDARAMAAKLTALGFDVALVTNARKPEIEEAIDRFSQRLTKDGVGLFYYAGHGVQVNGHNYLIPVEAEFAVEQSVRLRAVDVDAVLDQMTAAGTRVNLVILDACRENLAERRFRSSGGGLAAIDAPRGSYIAYATAPGKVAADGDGANGIYTGELLKALERKGAKVEDVFKQVRAAVDEKTHGAQLPWDSSSLTGDFYFSEPERAPPPPPPDPSKAAFEQVANSNEPIELLEFVKRFPTSIYRPQALARMNALLGGYAPPPVPVAPPAAPPAQIAMAAPEISRSTSPPPPFEQSLTTEDRQRIQRALAALGHLAGVADGSFGPGTRAAIKQFQSFQGDEETSQLTQPQRDALLGEATNLSMALERPDRSPRGVPARSLEGSTERWRRGFEHEAGNGAPKDLAEAVYWYGLAGADGQSAALQALGNMAVRGQGFAKPNPAMAERLWRAAAARGEAAAQHNLGVMFERGIGTTANRDAAISWYRRAAALRYADATAALKRLGQ